MKVWVIESREAWLSWEREVGGFHNICFSRDGETLATGSRDFSPVWDAKTGQQRTVLPKQTGIAGCVAFSPSEEILVTAGGTEESGEVHYWDKANWKQRWSIKASRGLVRCIAFVPDGKTLVTGEGMEKPGKVVLRDAETGSEQAVWDAHQ